MSSTPATPTPGAAPERSGATLLAGEPVAEAIRADVIARVGALQAHGVNPTLHLIRVGARDDDVHYEAGVVRQAGRVGVRITRDELPSGATQDQVADAVLAANQDASVHGIMVFEPLPSGLDAMRVNQLIAPDKDVDGLSPMSQAGVYTGQGWGFAPCTPVAVLAMLDHYRISLSGARVVIVGRSLVVGKPLAMLLLGRNATVTVCHSRTRDLAAVCRSADVVVAAMGRPAFLDADYFRPGQTVVDVGTNVDAAGRLVGDVDAGAVAPIVAALTPVRGGVGAVTSAVLFKHVTTAAERRSGSAEQESIGQGEGGLPSGTASPVEPGALAPELGGQSPAKRDAS